jgi:hypothetical protein
MYKETVRTSVRIAHNLVYVSSGTFNLLKGRLRTRDERAAVMNN